MDPVRKAIAIEAQAFVQSHDLDRLTPGLKEPAKDAGVPAPENERTVGDMEDI